MCTTHSQRPVLVVVEAGRYEVFALDSDPTFHDCWLFGLLQNMGGINESVEEGRYHFNATALSGDSVAVSLDKIEE